MAIEERVELPTTSHDIAAAMAVLQRRAKCFGVDEVNGLDLKGANLCGLSFRHADFQGANLEGALLIGTSFHECNLAHARLYRGDLRFGSMGSTLLNRANMQRMKASHAYFYYAAEVQDPSRIVAHPIVVDGQTCWKARSSPNPNRKVNGGRCLDGSHWDGTLLDKSDFQCTDLSGMLGLMPWQYEAFTKYQNVKEPNFSLITVNIVPTMNISQESPPGKNNNASVMSE